LPRGWRRRAAAGHQHQLPRGSLAALKRGITAIDIYDHAQEIRLDERRLSQGLGVSRTPIREAVTLLEQEGSVRTRPPRGIFVVRKTKRARRRCGRVFAFRSR
jgi:hypothetical protein